MTVESQITVGLTTFFDIDHRPWTILKTKQNRLLRSKWCNYFNIKSNSNRIDNLLFKSIFL